MAEKKCKHHGQEVPCSCAMGKLYRFIEPLVLQQLKKNEHAYGYELLESLKAHCLTDAAIDKAALYRTLRQLEEQAYVESEWAEGSGGPSRRVYRLTKSGDHHLQQWSIVMEQMAGAMMQFVHSVKNNAKDKKKIGRRPGQK
ncbi:PadR family transcriptional regulator [Telmatobacter bradus]|uniref:PadR family transcriptional regulator n=1 Tax=Telmatobacter bradus TaxID=474953 RepID=UPI003B42C28F